MAEKYKKTEFTMLLPDREFARPSVLSSVCSATWTLVCAVFFGSLLMAGIVATSVLLLLAGMNPHVAYVVATVFGVWLALIAAEWWVNR